MKLRFGIFLKKGGGGWRKEKETSFNARKKELSLEITINNIPILNSPSHYPSTGDTWVGIRGIIFRMFFSIILWGYLGKGIY